METKPEGQLTPLIGENWIAGAAGSTDLTPRGRMVPLAGYGHRCEPATGVHDAVGASALVLRDKTGRTAVVMTFDALFVGGWLDASLSDWLSQDYNVARNDILFLASHTHFAPALDRTNPLIGPAEHEHVEWVIGRCKRLLAGLLDGAVVKLTTCTGTSEWDGAIYRRRPWPLPYLIGRQAPVWAEPAMAPNPSGPVDTRISLWQLSAADGGLVAVLWQTV